jgi:outer membrane protein OmpA-like peptidoglycan-associated protein
MKQIYRLIEKQIGAISVAVVILLFSVPLFSQNHAIDPLFNKVSVGIRGGLNFPTMHYSDPDLNDYNSSLLIRGTFGGYLEIYFSNHFSIRPELMFTGRGQKIEDTGINYSFRSKYFDFHLPIIYNFQIGHINPYLMFGPSLGFSRGGQIILNDYSKEITTASIAPIDFSVMIGGGMKKPFSIAGTNFIAGIELAYSHGLSDTYSNQEKDGSADALNMGLYSIEGTRTNAGLSVTASIAIPFSNFIRHSEKVEPPKSLFAKEKEAENPDVKEIIKDCYTIEEINALIDAKKKVNNKVICMNNLNFEFNKSTLDKDSKTYLGNVVKLLEKVPSMKMKIIGHTDNVGTNEYNMNLSKKRAAAVYEYLTSKGISSDRIWYEYFGASKQLVPNDSDENRAKNRRVEFEIIEK